MTDKTILDAVGPDTMGELLSRREAIGRGVKVSAFTRAALSLGSVPVAIGALAGVSKAQATNPAIVDVLQYALLLENLEAEFYSAVLGNSTVGAFNTAFNTVRTALQGNAAALGTLQLLRAHEVAHVAALQTAIRNLGGTPTIYDPAATFDFTGNRGQSGTGPFAPATTDLNFLLALTQAVEDTGVRAYKGQAGRLLGTATLTTALRIHSLEARHAARIRRIRRVLGTATDTAQVRAAGLVKGGSTTSGTVAAPAAGYTGTLTAAQLGAFAAIYQDEQNTSHRASTGTIDASTLSGLPSGTDATMAFDEPLTAVQVVAIVQPFVRPTITLPTSLQS